MMAEPENLVLEHRRAIRGDMSRMVDRMETMATAITSMRLHLSGVVTIHEHDHGDIAALSGSITSKYCTI